MQPIDTLGIPKKDFDPLFSCMKCKEKIPVGSEYWSISVCREVQVGRSIHVNYAEIVKTFCLHCAQTLALFSLTVPEGNGPVDINADSASADRAGEEIDG